MADEEAQAQPSMPPSSTSGQSSSDPQAMDTSAFHGSQHSAPQMLPTVHSSDMDLSQNQEQHGHGHGLYAVQFSPFMGMMHEYPPSMLIPLTYKIPMRTNSTGAAGEDQGQGGDAIRQRGQHGPALHVRRFQLAFQLDLALLIKLAFAVILFGQDGSRKRTVILVLLATLVYLYQTGVLTPLIQYARRGLAPPRHGPRPLNADARQNDGNAGVDDQNHGNQNQPAEANQPPPEPEHQPRAPEQGMRMNLWGIAREIQTFVIGFIASLLPGFEQHND